MSRHSNQFQIYADAVKNELEMAYEQGRKDEREKIIIELEDVTTSAYLASALYDYIIKLKTYEDKVREEVIDEVLHKLPLDDYQISFLKELKEQNNKTIK